MNKARLETFSDGVFAIVITLLVLNIKLPDAGADLSASLITLLPSLLSYLLSFALVGLYWLGHHFYMDRIAKVDGNFVFMNMILLLFISILPFPTALLGRFPYDELALTLYGVNLLATNLISFVMLLYIYKNRHLANEHFKDEFFHKQLPIFLGVNGTYLLAIAFAFYHPVVSYTLFIAVMLLTMKVYVHRMNVAVRKQEKEKLKKVD